MTSIVDEVIGKPQPRAELFDEYRELLRPGREHNAGDVGRLKQLMHALGITGEQMRTHAEALRQVAEFEASLAGEAEAEEAAQAASAAWSAHEDETKRIIREREAQEVELRQAMQAARAQADGYQHTRRRIGGLRRQHRELFGEPEPVPDPQPSTNPGVRSPDPPKPVTAPATFA